MCCFCPADTVAFGCCLVDVAFLEDAGANCPATRTLLVRGQALRTEGLPLKASGLGLNLLGPLKTDRNHKVKRPIRFGGLSCQSRRWPIQSPAWFQSLILGSQPAKLARPWIEISSTFQVPFDSFRHALPTPILLLDLHLGNAFLQWQH